MAGLAILFALDRRSVDAPRAQSQSKLPTSFGKASSPSSRDVPRLLKPTDSPHHPKTQSHHNMPARGEGTVPIQSIPLTAANKSLLQGEIQRLCSHRLFRRSSGEVSQIEFDTTCGGGGFV